MLGHFLCFFHLTRIDNSVGYCRCCYVLGFISGFIESSLHSGFGIRKLVDRFVCNFILVLYHFGKRAKTFIFILVLVLLWSNCFNFILIGWFFLIGGHRTSLLHIFHYQSCLVSISIGEEHRLPMSFQQVLLLDQKLDSLFLLLLILLLFYFSIGSIQDAFLIHLQSESWCHQNTKKCDILYHFNNIIIKLIK